MTVFRSDSAAGCEVAWSAQIRAHIARIEREQREMDASAGVTDDELFRESPATAAERTQHFMTIKDFLTAPEPGTS